MSCVGCGSATGASQVCVMLYHTVGDGNGRLSAARALAVHNRGQPSPSTCISRPDPVPARHEGWPSVALPRAEHIHQQRVERIERAHYRRGHLLPQAHAREVRLHPQHPRLRPRVQSPGSAPASPATAGGSRRASGNILRADQPAPPRAHPRSRRRRAQAPHPVAVRDLHRVILGQVERSRRCAGVCGPRGARRG